MKKFLVTMLAVIAVMAFAVSVYAASQVELNGQIRVRGEYKHDFDLNNDARANETFYDQRVRLGAKATVTPNTSAVIELETGDNSSDVYKWGTSSSSNNSKPDGLSIRQAFISHQAKQFGLKVGHQLLSLGNSLFYDHTQWGDDAIVVTTPVGSGNLSLLAIKLDEGNVDENDDMDAYVAALSMPMGAVNFSGDLSYLVDSDKESAGSDVEGMRLWNLGLRGDTNVGGAKVKADIEIQTGKTKNGGTGGSDLKYKGFAAMIGAEANVGAAAVRANVAFGSGDKEGSANKNEGFQAYIGTYQHFTYLYEQKVVGGDKNGDDTIETNAGLNNTWYINLGATMKPSADLSVSGDIYYLRAHRAIDPSDNTKDSKNIGVEVDAKIDYKIDTNLSYYVEGGYLFAGDYYKNVTGTESPDNAWGVRHGLILSF